VKIHDVKISGFGVWNDMSVERLANDVTVFYGPNEAGKTTLMQFMRTVLYGFTRERRARYLPPVHGGQPGGSLRVGGPRGLFEIHRRAAAHELPDAPGETTVLDGAGAVQGAQQLPALLGGLDETIFSNVFAIGLREMQELGTLNDSAAADQLYKLTSGLDRVSLIDVMRELAEARQQILAPDDSTCQLSHLLDRHDRLRREVDELAIRGRRWPQLASQRSNMVKEIEELERLVQEVQLELQRYDLVLQVRDKWWQRRGVEEQLAAMGPPLDVVPDALEQLELMRTRLGKLRRKISQAKKQGQQLRQERDRHQVNRGLLSQASRIQALTEHGPWIGSLESEVQRLRSEVATLERELEARRPQIEMPAAQPKGKLPEISAKSLALLRAPAAKLNHLNKLVEKTQRDAQAVKVRTDQALQRVSSELADLDESSLSAALEKASTRVALLRRRIQLEERLDELAGQKKSLEDQGHLLFDGQVMPFNKMAWQFAGFVVAVLLIFTGFFGGWLWGFDGFLGFIISMFGFVMLGVSVFSKLEWDREARMKLENCERQRTLLEKQLQETEAEREELDEQLPAGGGPLDARLEQAEKNLQHLEQLTPMDAARHESGQHVEAAEQRATRAAEELKEARKNWQHALRSANLPEHLMPNDVRHLMKGFRQLSHVKRQLDQRREELESRRRELASLAGRITELFVEVGIKPDDESAQAQLKQLAAALLDQQQLLQRREGAGQLYRKARSRWATLRKRYDSITRARSSLLARANARDEDELRAMLTRQQQVAALRAQRETLSQEIRLVVSDQWSDEALARELLNREEDSPEKRRQRLQGRLHESKSKVAQLHEKRGQLAAEMKALADDRRLMEAKLELGCVARQIRKAAERWQLLAVIGLILESVRGTYETTRQPETLREASQFLEKLTQGQYARIWTPIEEKVLRVDDCNGQTLSLEKLSRGTREAVFLSLRLALVAGYARRGIVLPLILDDVLVNFDTGRVRSSARLLREFAANGHQLLFFTCHEHVMRIFKAENADIRVLPGRAVSGKLEPLHDSRPMPAPVRSPAAAPPNSPVLDPSASLSVVAATVPAAVTAAIPSVELPSAEDSPPPRESRPRRRRSSTPGRPAEAESQVISLATPQPTVVLQAASGSPESRMVVEPIVIKQRIEPVVIRGEETSTQVANPATKTAMDSRGELEKRFAWESPEMYWDRVNKEAVA